MPFGFHPVWLIIILVIVLIIFGPGKLPELGAAVGRAMRQFREATSDIRDEVTKTTEATKHEEPAPTSTITQATSTPAAATPAASPADPPAAAPVRRKRTTKSQANPDKA
jgi:sec-independent protein translocase protein TatA